MTNKIRILLITGGHIDFDKPDNFNIGVFCLSIRETGRFLADQVYVPHDKIVSIMELNETGEPIRPKVQGMLQ